MRKYAWAGVVLGLLNAVELVSIVSLELPPGITGINSSIASPEFRV